MLRTEYLLFLTLVIFPSTKTIFNVVICTMYIPTLVTWNCRMNENVKIRKVHQIILQKKILAIYSLRQYLAEDFVELAQKFCFVCIHISVWYSFMIHVKWELFIDMYTDVYVYNYNLHWYPSFICKIKQMSSLLKPNLIKKRYVFVSFFASTYFVFLRYTISKVHWEYCMNTTHWLAKKKCFLCFFLNIIWVCNRRAVNSKEFSQDIK